MQEMYNRGMDTQRDTATAAARSAQPGWTVIGPGMGAATVIQPGTSSPASSGSGTSSAHEPARSRPEPPPPTKRVVVCPKCHQEIEESQKFCDNCAHQFY